MAIKLHGIPRSNYYNMVKCALLEQGLQFTEVAVRPNQEAEFLNRSPMGKVPCIETEDGFISETSAILEYLHEIGSGSSLFPEESYARAKVREMMRLIELYIELPARRLYGEVFFNTPTTDSEKTVVRGLLEKGFAALDRTARYDPYVCGSDFTYADIYFRFSVSLATLVCKKALAWDAYNEIPRLRPLLELLEQRESVQRILKDQARAA